MFNNKHVIVAMLVAPILAVLTWFAVGSFVGEKPHAAKSGQSYPLVERSNCRYDSGQCDLDNEDMRLSITLEGGPVPGLVLASSQPLEGALLGVADVAGDEEPAQMRRVDSAGRRWLLTLDRLPAPPQRLRIVVRFDHADQGIISIIGEMGKQTDAGFAHHVEHDARPFCVRVVD